MKKILAKDLQKGDLFYYKDTYREVISDRRHRNQDGTFVEVKCIMSPTPTKKEQEDLTGIDYGTESYLIDHVEVLLLCRDGEVV